MLIFGLVFLIRWFNTGDMLLDQLLAFIVALLVYLVIRVRERKTT